MRAIKKTVLIAGATGYLGRHLISAYHAAGYRVVALARRPEALIGLNKHIDEIIYGEATKPETLDGVMTNVDLVVSALGITRQKDGLSFAQVDYQANRNLLDAALESGVAQFLYVHVKNAEQMPGVEMAAAKARFAAELDAADIHSTIVAPSGFFSDLVEVLEMARRGRVHLFGDGKALISPIDGHDLAAACVAASEEGTPRIEVGGPQTLSLNDIAEMAFAAIGKTPRVTHLPVTTFRALFNAAKWLGLGQKIGALDFFAAASQLDMSAPANGSRELSLFFASEAGVDAAQQASCP
jgi:uncharacterized protein YbjT (DUF2867 family)